MPNDEEWIDARTAARILGVSERHVNRLGTVGDIQMRRTGPRRVLYARSDVERLASERPREPLVPRSEMLPMRDAVGTLVRAEHDRDEAKELAGYLRGQLELTTQRLDEQTKLLADAQEARIELARAQEQVKTAEARQAAAEARLALAQAQLEEMKHSTPWWKRWLGRE